MYFPDPTQKPTAADYAWARNLKGGDLGLRIDWALRQFALRGMWENEFCAGAGVFPTYIPLIRKKAAEGNSAPRGADWNKFINHLEATENKVPECLWAHQDLFPYSEANYAKATRYLQQAGFTLYSLRLAMQAWTGQEHSNFSRVKAPNPKLWQSGLVTIFESLAAAPIPDIAPGRLFPYDPDARPQLAARQMQRLWRLQEAAGLNEAELSRSLGRYDGAGKAASYARLKKLHRETLPVHEYAKLVKIIYSCDTLAKAAEVSHGYRQFFPHSTDAYKRLMLRITRLGITYQQIEDTSQALWGDAGRIDHSYARSMVMGIIKIPAQENWRKLVLACQHVEEKMRRNFIQSWEEYYAAGQKYADLARDLNPCDVFEQLARRGEQISPIPASYLAPILRAGITLGGKIGKSYPLHTSGKFAPDAIVADVLQPIEIAMAPGDQDYLQPPARSKELGRLRIVVHGLHDNRFIPVTIVTDRDELAMFDARVWGRHQGYGNVKRMNSPAVARP